MPALNNPITAVGFSPIHPSMLAAKAVSGTTYTITPLDVALDFTGASLCAVTVPSGLPNGFSVSYVVSGSGAVSFVAGSGVALGGTAGNLNAAAGSNGALITTSTANSLRLLNGSPASSSGGAMTGAGSPEGSVAAPVGTFYGRTDGGGAAVYYKATGTGSTGWLALVTASATVAVPGAPTSVVATAGNGLVSVAFVAPSNNGGASITGYRVTLSTGQTQNGASSPISVTAPNDTPVTATVQAQNSVGFSAASSVSNSATPTSGGGVVAPTITTQPQSQSIVDGQTVTVSVAASNGGGTLSYQWQVAAAGGSFTDQSGATSASYTSGALNTGMTGRQYRVVVTNSAGSVTSNVATITVAADGGGDVDMHVADFSGVTVNTDLIEFAPQLGGVYTKQTGASAGDITGQALITTTGYCRGPSTAGAASLAYAPTGGVATPGSGGVRGYVKFHVFSNTTAQSIALYLRNTNTAGSAGSGANGVHGKYQGGRFGIVKRIGIVETELAGLDVPAIVVGNDVEMEFRVAAGVQKLYYRMVGDTTWILACSATEPDSGITPGTDAGIRFGSSSTWGATDTGPRLRELRFGTCGTV